ncbi:glycosyltransferase family 2 protein [Azospirillum sp. SYSU D00513]|uniref:glycosyltransferase family 2 protein n=1 Tax=Azospirillum sp. SYSU D00513 TaxID=2812561 RepID=UPI001A978C9D|nr:glycosyltransferase family 2 protein [Azospirillum sp. SYSU D00513]
MAPVKTSVIVSTYNWPAALRVSLTSLLAQDRPGFEVIVADDGSAGETRDLVQAMGRGAPVPVRHVWHPDEGFRLAAIRNRAIAAAEGDYLILIDGDCFVLPDFVRTHRALAEEGCFVSGKRSYLRAPMTRDFLEGRRDAGQGRAAWMLHGLAGRCTRPLRFLKLPLGPLRHRRPDDWRRVQTCNMGVWRRDAVAVNGFDGRYQGWGQEDSDFVVRLLRHGLRRKLGDFANVVMHLDHPTRGGGPANEALLRSVIEGTGCRAVQGLEETVEEGEAASLRSALTDPDPVQAK